MKILTLIFAMLATFALSSCGSSGTSSSVEIFGAAEDKPQVATPYVLEAHHGSTAVVHSHVTPSESGDEHAHEWTQVSGPTVALTTPTEQTTTFIVPTDTPDPVVLQHAVTNVQTGQSTTTHHTVVPIAPPATQPPAPQPPATQPPATQPPATQPPATQPPATQPPATQPPAPLNLVVSTHNGSIPSGSKASLHVSVSGGDGQYTYVWTKISGPAITDYDDHTHPSAPTFTAPTVTTTEILTFSVMVTDGQGATKDATETITVNPPPGPLSVTSISGPSKSTGNFNLSVTASGGSGNYVYAWFVDRNDGKGSMPAGDTPTITVVNTVKCANFGSPPGVTPIPPPTCLQRGEAEYNCKVTVTDLDSSKAITQEKKVIVTGPSTSGPTGLPPPLPSVPTPVPTP